MPASRDFPLKRFRDRVHYFAETDVWPAAGVVRRGLCLKCQENPSVRVARECAARRFRLPQREEPCLNTAINRCTFVLPFPSVW